MSNGWFFAWLGETCHKINLALGTLSPLISVLTLNSPLRRFFDVPSIRGRATYGALLIQKLHQRDCECISNSSHHHQARVSLPPLNATHTGQVNLCLERKLLLGQPPLLTEASVVRAEYRPPIDEQDD